MDYEKAYKDIVAKVKKAHLFAQTDSTKKVLEDILPQLRESEDERMRKAALAGIEYLEREIGWDVIDDIDILDVKDYLEKQKEQRPMEYLDKDKVYATMKKLHDLSFSQLIPINSDEYKKIDEITCDIRNFLNYPIEQKPAEWVLPEDFEEAVYKVANFISPFDSQDELRRVSHRFAEQLMSLAKKELDKPAEWSEEDEGWFKYILEELNAYLKDYEGAAEAGMKEAIKWFKTRLKSLRPSWKPSEGDIKMLEHIIWQYETGNKNSKVMGYLPRVEELGFLKKVLSKWKN